MVLTKKSKKGKKVEQVKYEQSRTSWITISLRALFCMPRLCILLSVDWQDKAKIQKKKKNKQKKLSL